MRVLIFLFFAGCVSAEQSELKGLKELKKECELVKKEIDSLKVQVLPKMLETMIS